MKKFKEFLNEDTTTANVVGTGDDVADWYYKKKKRKPLTRHYIEIGGKIKKQVR